MNNTTPWLASWRVRVGALLALLHLAGGLSLGALASRPFAISDMAAPTLSIVGAFLLALIDRHLHSEDAPLRVLGRALDPRHRPQVVALTRPRFLDLALLVPIFAIAADAYRPLVATLTRWGLGGELVVMATVLAGMILLMLLLAGVLLLMVWRLQRLLGRLQEPPG